MFSEIEYATPIRGRMIKVRLVIGIICIAISIWMLLSSELSENPAPAIVVLIIGISIIAISKRRK